MRLPITAHPKKANAVVSSAFLIGTMKNRVNKSFGIITLIIFFFLFSCASTQQKQIGSRDAEVYYKQGSDYLIRGQYDQAISDLNKALEINPRYAEAYSNRGLAYTGKVQYDQAILDLNKAIETNPRLAIAYLNRGIAYWYKVQYDRAISDYTKALEINPKDAMAYYNRIWGQA